jgi:hypothetical protein
VARKTGKLVESEVTELRSAAAAIAADNATLTDANIPPASAFSSQEFDSVLLSAEITGGASPSFTLELLLRDLEAPDGQRWKRLALAKRFGGDDSTPQTTVTLDGTKFVEVLTYGAEGLNDESQIKNSIVMKRGMRFRSRMICLVKNKNSVTAAPNRMRILKPCGGRSAKFAKSKSFNLFFEGRNIFERDLNMIVAS